MKPKILIVDDEPQLLAQMRWVLDGDYDVLTATNEHDAINVFERECPSVAVVDLSLDRTNPKDLGGLRLIEKFLGQAPATRVIVITGNEDEANALSAVRLGAYDYYSKPIRLADLKIMIKRAIEIYRIHERLYANHVKLATYNPENSTRQDRSLPQSNSPGTNPVPMGATHGNLKLAKKAIEVEFVKKALAKNNGIVSRAARELGISRVNLYELIEKHAIQIKAYKVNRARAGRQNNSGGLL